MRKLIGGSAQIVALTENSKYAKIVGMYVELVSSQTGNSKAHAESILDSDFVAACLASLDHCVNSNLFLQLFLLNSGLGIHLSLGVPNFRYGLHLAKPGSKFACKAKRAQSCRAL